MDFRVGPAQPGKISQKPLGIRISPRADQRLRSAVTHVVDQARSHSISHAISQKIDQAKDQAPKAEAAAARLVERTRPAWSWLVQEWRRLGTAAALLLIVVLVLHAMFGANGMVVYQQKRAEMQALQNEVDSLQKENAQYADQINSLKSDPAAIEKEAREQLHYTRQGEVVYVAPGPTPKPPTGRAGNQ
jgi:cell division protein FtsB